MSDLIFSKNVGSLDGLMREDRPVPRAASIQELPLSHAQQSLWFMSQLVPDHPFYNLPSALLLRGELDIVAMRSTFSELVARHEALRTRFPAREGKPIQQVSPAHPLEVPLIVVEGADREERRKRAYQLATEEGMRPFDLALGPLLRVVLFKIDDQEHLLTFTMHHIVTDGWSIGVMSREIPLLYEAFRGGEPSPLARLAIQYGDYALWQRERLAGEALEPSFRYWHQRLARHEDLDLPTDLARPAIQSHRGAVLFVEIPPILRDRLEALAQREGMTLFMAMLAVFHLLMSRLSGQKETLVGTPMANRDLCEVEGLIGFFANSLVLPCDLSGNPSFRELLGRVREETLRAYEHRAVPFELLVEQLRVERNPSRNPLFQVMFALQKSSVSEIKFPGLEAEALNLENPTTHFDMEWHLWNREDGLGGYISYSLDLFEPATIVRMAGQFLALAEAALADPEKRIGELELLSDWELDWLAERSRGAVANSSIEAAALGLRMSSGKAGASDSAVEPKVDVLFRADVQSAAEEFAVRAEEGLGRESRPTLLARLLEDASRGGGRVWLRTGSDAWDGARLADAVLRGRASLVPFLRPGDALIWCAQPSPESVAAALAAWSLGAVLVPAEGEAGQDELTALAAGSGARLVLAAKSLPALPSGLSGVVAFAESDGECLSLTISDLVTNLVSVPKVPLALKFRLGNQWASLDQDALCLRALETAAAQGLRAGETVFCAGLTPTAWFLELTAQLFAEACPLLVATEKISLGSLPADLLVLGLDSLSAFLSEPQPQSGSREQRLVGIGALPSPSLLARMRQRSGGDSRWLYQPPESLRLTGAIPVAVGADLALRFRPCQGLTILDDLGLPVPIGVVGKIHLNESDAVSLGSSTANPLSPGTRLVATGERGRWRLDGTLELRGPDSDRLLWRGERLDLSSLAAELLRDSRLEQVRVMPRLSELGWEPVAYLVPKRMPQGRDFEERVLSQLPPSRRPTAALLLSRLPHDSKGQCDDKALGEYAIVHSHQLERVLHLINSQPGVLKAWVAFKNVEFVEKIQHISDLIPGWKNEKTPTPFLDRADASHSQEAQKGKDEMLPERPAAYASGGPLEIAVDAPKTLTQALQLTATRFPEKGIHCYQENGETEFTSYPELLRRAKAVLAGLRASGLEAGDRVILQLERLSDHFACFWGCVLGGIVPVTVAIASDYSQRNSVVNKLWNTWKLLRGPSLIHNQSLAAGLAGIPSLFAEAPFPYRMLRAEALLAQEATEVIHAPEATDVVFYQLTSGSTGVPKCIQETHSGIIHHVLGSAQFNGYESGDVSLNWLPMDHVVPILTCHLRDVYLGIEQVHVRTPLVLADPLKWLELMGRHRATLTWAPNFGYKLVNDALARAPERHFDLSSLRYAMNAGEQVTLPVVTEWLKRTQAFGVSPRVMQPSFGMAECCTCMTYLNQFSLDQGAFWMRKDSLNGLLREAEPGSREAIAFVDLGPVMPGVEIRITDGENRQVSEGVIGRFQIRGAVTTPGYLYNEEANREAFVGDGWFNSGDLGFIRHGRLALTGREKEIIIIRGANFYCYEIEDVVNGIPGVLPTFSAAIAVQDGATGSETLAVFFVPAVDQECKAAPDVGLLARIREVVARDLGISPGFVIPIPKADFPKTTSGKIQRTALKKALAAGTYDGLLRQIDLAFGNANTLPDQFIEKCWSLAALPHGQAGEPSGLTLVFADEGGLYEALAARLGGAVWRVTAGKGFHWDGESRIVLHPELGADVRELAALFAREGKWPERVVWLWSLQQPGAGPGSQQAPACLLRILEAIREAGLWERVPSLFLLWAGRFSQAVGTGETLSLQQALIQPLLKSAARELVKLSVRHLDLDPKAETDELAQQLCDELHAPNAGEEAAYRGGVRWVPRLRPLSFPAAKSPANGEEPILQTGGFYLITGGLGGLGQYLAHYLLANFQARLLLIGRSSSESNAAALREWRARGEVEYAAVDCRDFEALRATADPFFARWGEPTGIFHLAGSFETAPLSALDPDLLQESLCAKLDGARALRQLLPSTPLVAFGSVNAFFGGATAGVYSAANRALEAWVENERAAGRTNARIIGWSMWDEVGMSAGYPLKDLSRELGFATIEPRKGLLALRALLAHQVAVSYFGLDSRKPAVRAHVDAFPAVPLRELTAWYSAKSDFNPADLARLELRDPFGQPVRIAVRRLDQLPSKADGSIDETALLNRSESAAAGPLAAPRSSTEKWIASIWRELLGLEQVDIHRSFFELGGQSVLLIQVHHRLHQVLNRELTVVDLLRYPTIAALAQFLDREQKAKPSFDHAQQRALQQKMAMQQRKPLRRPGK